MSFKSSITTLAGGGEEYVLRESSRLISQGGLRKVLILLDKVLDKAKRDKTLTETLTLRLARRYMSAGMGILREYEARNEIQTK